MKKQILSLGVKLTKTQQQSVLGGGDPSYPIGPPGGGGNNGGGGPFEGCANQATCTHAGDCYNVINGSPSSCVAGCCITPN